MRHFILFAITLLVAACSSLSSAERAERDAKIAQSVEKALAERRYTVSINTVYPRSGRVVNVSPDYSLEVKGDTLVSYLPYFGRAYNVPYGGGKGYNFTAPITDYQATKNRKGNTRITFRTYNEEDIITFMLDIFPNGNATIDVTAREREPISYSGQMEVE